MSIAGEAVADDLGIDGRATRLGVLEFFEHHHAGTLAHDEAVTVDVPRARAPLGRVVELGRQRARSREARDADAADSGPGAPPPHHTATSPHNEAGGHTPLSD